MKQTLFLQQHRILKEAAHAPYINCGVGHEMNPPHEVCTLGKTPRHRIGCTHSDVPMLLMGCLRHVYELLRHPELKDMERELIFIKKHIGILDNDVYEKRCTDEDERKKRQREVATRLGKLVERYIEFADSVVTS